MSGRRGAGVVREQGRFRKVFESVASLVRVGEMIQVWFISFGSGGFWKITPNQPLEPTALARTPSACAEAAPAKAVAHH